MKLYFKRGVVSGFMITVLAIGALGVYAYISIRKLIEGSMIQSRSLLTTTYAEKVLTTALDLETAQRGYVITGDSVYLEPYNNAINSIDNNLALLSTVTDPYPGKHVEVEELKRLVKQKMDFVTGTIQARGRSFEEAQARIVSGEGKRMMDKVRVVIDQVRATEADIYGEEFAQAGSRLASIQFTFVGALVVPGILVIVLFYSINSNLNKKEDATRKLQKANDDVTKLNHELESFSYSVSHDLRAPLRSVNGYAKILLEDYGDELDDEAKRTINVIARNGQRMGELIDDLLDFSRLGRKELQATTVSMDAVVQQVLDEIRESKYYSENIKIGIKALPDANADISMIRQVWYNLISNALKYSSKTDIPTVEIGSFLKDDEVCYYVKDNGVGFDMAYANKLFGIFQRLHKQNEFEGTGVGLALIKRIIDRHDGNVWAEAELNKGATFFFSIPR
jgi:signal transduction histidine kinase